MLQYSATRWFYARYICVHAIVDYFYTKDSNTRFLGVCVLCTLARYCGENTVHGCVICSDVSTEEHTALAFHWS